jgi:sodium transport system permease protein
MLERIWVVFSKEVMDNLRDRRTLLSSLAYPLLGPVLIAVMLSVVGGTLISEAERPLRLPVQGAEHAPALIRFLEQNNVEIVTAPNHSELLRAGRPAPVRLVVDESRQSTAAATQRARRLLEAYSGEIAALRLLARGISPSVVTPLAIERMDVATPQSQAANLLSIAPYFIIFSIFIGGMYLAIDTTTGERERGSLEPLLINPLSRAEFVLGKYAATLLFTVIAVVETLIAFGLVLNYIPLEIPLSLDASVLFNIFLISLPIMLLAAALQMIVATFSKDFKEAQNFLSYMMLIPALPGMFLAFLPVRPSLWMMAIPTFGQQVLINQVMRGNVVDPSHVVVSAVVTLLVGLLLLGGAIYLYNRESVLFRGG